MSPAWLALIITWSVLGAMPMPDPVYFSASNPLVPMWPYVSGIPGWVFLATIYGMLLLPKLVGVLTLAQRRRVRASYGGTVPFLATAGVEIASSVIYAPVLMVQQTIAVLQALVGQGGWAPQARGAQGHSWGQVLRFHVVEVLLGLTLLVLILGGGASAWLGLIAASLIGAPVLSKLSVVPLANMPLAPLRLAAPNNLYEPQILRAAKQARAVMKDALDRPVMPAE